MAVRGIRGATVVPHDTSEEILAATTELLETLIAENGIDRRDVASIIFTVTPDLRSDYPARAARNLGWDDVALLGATEMDVPEGLARCIRVLMHVNTNRSQNDVKHIYLREARGLRPDR